MWMLRSVVDAVKCVKSTLKSVSQDVFSAKETLGLNVTKLKKDFIGKAVHCSTHSEVKSF